MTPMPGTRIEARNAYGDVVSMVALTAPKAGLDFTVVWVCTEKEYDRAQAANEEPAGVPWPLDAIVETATAQ